MNSLVSFVRSETLFVDKARSNPFLENFCNKVFKDVYNDAEVTGSTQFSKNLFLIPYRIISSQIIKYQIAF